jgi:hypothetical protein
VVDMEESVGHDSTNNCATSDRTLLRNVRRYPKRQGREYNTPSGIPQRNANEIWGERLDPAGSVRLPKFFGCMWCVFGQTVIDAGGHKGGFFDVEDLQPLHAGAPPTSHPLRVFVCQDKTRGLRLCE